MYERTERYLFHQRIQQPGETIEDFVAHLRKLSKSCDFEHLEDSLIRDRIGIRDDATRRRLLQQKKVTLSDAVEACKASEATSQRLRTTGRCCLRCRRGRRAVYCILHVVELGSRRSRVTERNGVKRVKNDSVSTATDDTVERRKPVRYLDNIADGAVRRITFKMFVDPARNQRYVK